MGGKEGKKSFKIKSKKKFQKGGKIEVIKSKKIGNKTYTAVFDSDYVASDKYVPTKVFGSVFVFDEEGKKVEFTFEANGLAASVTASDDVERMSTIGWWSFFVTTQM